MQPQRLQSPAPQGAGKLSTPRPDSPTPMGAINLECPQLGTSHQLVSDDDKCNGTDKGIFTTFAFQYNELLISIGTKTALAKIDLVADLNLMSKSFLDYLPVEYKTKFRHHSKVSYGNGSIGHLLGEISQPFFHPWQKNFFKISCNADRTLQNLSWHSFSSTEFSFWSG